MAEFFFSIMSDTTSAISMIFKDGFQLVQNDMVTGKLLYEDLLLSN